MTTENPTLQLLGYQKIEGQITCVTGLHIGAAAETSVIMGLDNPIIKDPATGLPYIPGSSVKGKLRSLLELSDGKLGERGGVHKCSNEEARDCAICRIFGVAGDMECDFGPGRMIVRDAMLSKSDDAENVNKRLHADKKMELKWENTINRVSGTAEHPRQTERVPAGATFDFVIDYRIFDTGDGGRADKKHFQHILEAMQMLEQDYLGGSGSRGYGQISFGVVNVTYHESPAKRIRISDMTEV